MQTNQPNILIVEDDRFQRVILMEMLRSLGLDRITEATNGLQALEVIRQNTSKIDLIFSDLRMPGMDGMEFLRLLGEESYQIEIVILSAVDKKLLSVVNKISDLYHIKLLGILKKPVTLQQLKLILADRGKTQLSAKPNEYVNKNQFSVEEIIDGIRQKQFKPYLQPKVDLKSGMIVGAEALARWIHPTHGVIPPSAFIPLLEESEQIDALTFVMLEEAAGICKQLLDSNHNIQIAVNLSLVSLNNSQIAEKITSTITSSGVGPEYITLEITESAAMTDAPVALENLARLYMNGFTLSIDDYGTGYSNLQQLTRIAFGELKIDQSFVQGFANNESMMIVVASNIDMAHKLNIKSVAEGVETAQDWEMLRKMECDVGQGYYIAKPMSAEDFYDFVDQHRDQAIQATPKAVHHLIKTRANNNSQYKILVIQDNIPTRNALLKTLSALGYQQTTHAADADSALKLFETTQFDLIITEAFTPDMNGLELIKRIRTNKTLAKANIRIIVYSALIQSKVVGTALALGVNGFLTKPLILDVIAKKIQTVMSEPNRILASIAYETVDTAFENATPYD
jgi:EAL domain-containing protein (putative c-di-GMP-specific phosphodiesterase class I)/DNA-binding NarL/FixJ family response regulator